MSPWETNEGPTSRSQAGVVILTLSTHGLCASALPPLPLRGCPSLDDEHNSFVLRCPGACLPSSVHRSCSPPLFPHPVTLWHRLISLYPTSPKQIQLSPPIPPT